MDASPDLPAPDPDDLLVAPAHAPAPEPRDPDRPSLALRLALLPVLGAPVLVAVAAAFWISPVLGPTLETSWTIVRDWLTDASPATTATALLSPLGWAATLSLLVWQVLLVAAVPFAWRWRRLATRLVGAQLVVAAFCAASALHAVTSVPPIVGFPFVPVTFGALAAAWSFLVALPALLDWRRSRGTGRTVTSSRRARLVAAVPLAAAVAPVAATLALSVCLDVATGATVAAAPARDRRVAALFDRGVRGPVAARHTLVAQSDLDDEGNPRPGAPYVSLMGWSAKAQVAPGDPSRCHEEVSFPTGPDGSFRGSDVELGPTAPVLGPSGAPTLPEEAWDRITTPSSPDQVGRARFTDGRTFFSSPLLDYAAPDGRWVEDPTGHQFQRHILTLLLLPAAEAVPPGAGPLCGLFDQLSRTTRVVSRSRTPDGGTVYRLRFDEESTHEATRLALCRLQRIQLPGLAAFDRAMGNTFLPRFAEVVEGTNRRGLFVHTDHDGKVTSMWVLSRKGFTELFEFSPTSPVRVEVPDRVVPYDRAAALELRQGG